MPRVLLSLLLVACSLLLGSAPNWAQDTPPKQKPQEVIGIGGGAGGRYGGRVRRRAPSAEAIQGSLAWLASHQSPDGSWSAGDSDASDVRVTALALLAFLGDGHTTVMGTYKRSVLKGTKWLKEQQDAETGRFGPASAPDLLLDQALATLAYSEVYYLSRSPLLRADCQRAVDLLLATRHGDGGWGVNLHEDAPASSPSDVLGTCWALLALSAADDAKLSVEPAVFAEGLAFLESRSSANGEVSGGGAGAAAAALFTRLFRGQHPGEHPELLELSKRMVADVTEGEAELLEGDAVYRYFGTYALFQLSAVEPDGWKAWSKAMQGHVTAAQETEGDERGSWDPVGLGPGGGGRVEATALNTLCLEVAYRYARLITAR